MVFSLRLKIIFITVAILIFAIALAGLYVIKKQWAIPVVIVCCGVLGLLLQI